MRLRFDDAITLSKSLLGSCLSQPLPARRSPNCCRLAILESSSPRREFLELLTLLPRLVTPVLRDGEVSVRGGIR